MHVCVCVYMRYTRMKSVIFVCDTSIQAPSYNIS